MTKWFCASHKTEKDLAAGKCFSARGTYNPGRAREFAYDEMAKGRWVTIKASDSGAVVTLSPQDFSKTIVLPE